VRHSTRAVRALLSPRAVDQAARGSPVPRQSACATLGADDVVCEAALAVRADVAALRLGANAEAIECAIDERQQLVERLRRVALQLASHAPVSSSHSSTDVASNKPFTSSATMPDARPCNVCPCCCAWRPRYSILEAEYATLASSHELLRGRSRQQSARLDDQEERWQKTEQRLGEVLARSRNLMLYLAFSHAFLAFFLSRPPSVPLISSGLCVCE
jgi:hypothetical protein